MANELSIPIPLDPLTEDPEDRRLWIGNLDPRVTELESTVFICLTFFYWFVLLKLLQQYGKIEKFDLLFHRSGPLEGQPRGYAFVTFSTKDYAKTALKKLNGKLVGNKILSVKSAHNVGKDDCVAKQKIVPDIPALSGAKSEVKLSKVSTIQAIEAKLKTMEATASLEFEITNRPSTSTANSVFSVSKPKEKKFIKHKFKPFYKSKCKGNT